MSRAEFWLPSRLRRPPSPKPLPTGFDAWVHRLHGYCRRLPWRRWQLRRLAERVVAAQPRYESLPDTELRQQLQACREGVRRDREPEGDALVDAFALLSEAAYRSLGMRPYPVQLMGALALHQGLLAEMATGEGKTLTASLPAVLAGWGGRPVHVLTANDYLAARDAEEMAPLYQYCGLTVSAVVGEMELEQRVPRYRADVVYLTAKELLGDFLKDRLAERQGPDVERILLKRWSQRHQPVPTWSPGHFLLSRGLDTVIVDEADSLLIDEAVTPLILSIPRTNQGMAQAVLIASEVADQLAAGLDYEVLVKQKSIQLKPPARTLLAQQTERMPRLWQAAARREELLRQALVARHFFKRDQQYVVLEDKIVLLDESTGRMTPNRTLSAGLHQALEAAEHLPISDPTETLGQMSFQAFFRHFRKLAGTTGTAREAAAELWQIYDLTVLSVPTHRPALRQVATPQVFLTEHEKWNQVVATLERIHSAGRPVLVGVRSIVASEHLAERLTARGLPFDLLNALRHQQEAEIVRGAGNRGRITVATNMAGRGTDIKLQPGVRELGGLHVILTECYESARIDRQLMGRCSRQGDPGSVSILLSLEDEILQRFLPRAVLSLLQLLRRNGWPGSSALVRQGFRLAQYLAQSQAFLRRKSVLQSDTWLQEALPFGDDQRPGN